MKPILLIIFLLASNFAQAQLDTIYVMAPSFEDISEDNETNYWTDCGDARELAFPVFDNSGRQFGVTAKAFEGDYFVGLVVRKNGTTEGMSQYLDKQLLAGKIYQFSVLLRAPKVFTNQGIDFAHPVIFEVYGGSDACTTDELLAFTEAVTEKEWMQFDFVLEPTDDFDWLSLRVGFLDNRAPYNGSVLLDYVSDIIEIE